MHFVHRLSWFPPEGGKAVEWIERPRLACQELPSFAGQRPWRGVPGRLLGRAFDGRSRALGAVLVVADRDPGGEVIPAGAFPTGRAGTDGYGSVTRASKVVELDGAPAPR